MHHEQRKKFAQQMEFRLRLINPTSTRFVVACPQKAGRNLGRIWQDVWDPKKLPWDTFNASKYTWEAGRPLPIGGRCSVFDASAPPVFASAFIKKKRRGGRRALLLQRPR